MPHQHSGKFLNPESKKKGKKGSKLICTTSKENIFLQICVLHSYWTENQTFLTFVVYQLLIMTMTIDEKETFFYGKARETQ